MKLSRANALVMAIVLAIAAGGGVALWRDHEKDKTMNQIAERFPDYAAFRAAVDELPAPHDDLIIFLMPAEPLFQDIRQNATAFAPFMTRYLTDTSVPYDRRQGLAASMLDLPDDQLVQLLSAIEAKLAGEPKLGDMLYLMITNSYRGSNLVDGGEISDRALIDRAHKPEIRALLERIAGNPAMSERDVGPGTPIGDAIRD